MTTRLTPQEERIASFLKAARVDHRPYMERCLKIVGKDSKLVPLRLNAAQLLIHTALEQQLKDYKMVRAMILKGRKMGSSTYVGGRFYVKTRLWPYREAVVMAHTKDSAQKLFRM